MPNHLCQFCKKEFHSPRKLSKYCSHKCYSFSLCGKPAWNKGKPRTWKASGDFKEGHTPWNIRKRIDRRKYPLMGHFRKHLAKTKQQISRKKKREWQENPEKYTIRNQQLRRQMKGNKFAYKKGWTKSNGYVSILLPGGGYVRRARFVVEQYLHRHLTKEEIHHINEIKDDDRPENLYIFPSKSAHFSFHRLKRKPILTSNLTSVQK